MSTKNNAVNKTGEGPMLRRINSFPADLVARIDHIAKEQGESFSEIVRRACWSYSPELGNDDEKLLESMLDMLIEDTNKVASYITTVEKKLDKTHKELKKNAYGHR